MWKIGDRLKHRFNGDLGPGSVIGIEGRTVLVSFPLAHQTLRLASDSDALERMEIRPGSRARLAAAAEPVTVRELGPDGTALLVDGRRVAARELMLVEGDGSPVEELRAGRAGSAADLVHRLRALELRAMREAQGLGSFLGGRILLFPHQLYVAERATQSDPVRWLLADEVGLGKTVEACLVLNHLIRTRRTERVMVVAPQTLTVQWLGELWRKYHRVFVLLDRARLLDVTREFGKGFNPFDAYRRVIVSLETLVENPVLSRQAAEAGIDLLIVDEAQHLKRPPGHPGNPAYRAIAPIAAIGRHALLLSAVPLEDDAHGFLRLLQLLRPDELPEGGGFEARLASRSPLPACTSATRRVDIGGLPPRVARVVRPGEGGAWAKLLALEEAVAAQPADNVVQQRAKADRLRRALASPAALLAVAERGSGLEPLAAEAERDDPRVGWLVAAARQWHVRGEKTLVFVAHRETLEMLRRSLRAEFLATGAFHEDMSPGQRDIEVAQFRLADGPSLLVATECGGEGRNFQFCHRLVLFDLPWNPMLVEQRIGRLDRIGRTIPVEIVYFEAPAGLGRTVARLYGRLGLFRHPLGGLYRELASVEDAVTDAALRDDADGAVAAFDELVSEARGAWSRVERAAYHQLHQEPWEASREPSITARIPAELEQRTESVVRYACDRLGLHLERQRGRAVFSFEFGNLALIDSLPEVPGGSNFLGTFDRQEAVENEALDFFASGHPLVEGILADLDENACGRTAVLEMEGDAGLGLIGVYRSADGFRAVAVDEAGRPRPEWAERALADPVEPRGLEVAELPDWGARFEAMVAALPPGPEALAVVVARARVVAFPSAARRAGR